VPGNHQENRIWTVDHELMADSMRVRVPRFDARNIEHQEVALDIEWTLAPNSPAPE